MSNLSERLGLFVVDLVGSASDERTRSGRIIRRGLALLAVVVAVVAIILSTGRH